MKLLRFTVCDGPPIFGLAVGPFAFSFDALSQLADKSTADQTLASMESYLENLPRSHARVRELAPYAAARCDPSEAVEGRFALKDCRILSPIARPAALIDFGLTPKHLENSARVLLRHEWGSLLATLAWPVVRMALAKTAGSDDLPYYKGNHLEIVGDSDEMGWPDYTSYLDIEPELAFVTGTKEMPIAGYLIFNDGSARDVQFPEMIGTGPARCKDFHRSNGLGPYLVTPEEVPDPLSLEVTVRVGDRFRWHGHTSEYRVHPQRVFDYLSTVFPLAPGMVIGMGTVPGCTGLDNDRWPEPGDEVEITFAGLGTLRQRIPRIGSEGRTSRWEKRRFSA